MGRSQLHETWTTKPLNNRSLRNHRKLGRKMSKQIGKLIVNKRLTAERIRAWTEYQAANTEDIDEVEKLDADYRNANIGRKL